jgi:hypothetical protein
MECNMKRLTIVLGVLAAAAAGSMTFAVSAATDKANAAAPSGAAPASTAPSGTAPASTAPAAAAPAGAAQATGKANDAAAPGKGAVRGQRGSDTGSLLTPAERSAHEAAMNGLKSFDECTAVMAKYNKLLADRAKEKGVAVPAERGNVCERMKARGFNP